MAHSLDSSFVRDQLALRVALRNVKRTQPDGEFVLYWMHSTLRLEENWALRYATLEANRLGRPLLIHHQVDPRDRYASVRSHTFVLQGASDLAEQAAQLGHHYQLTVPADAAGAAHVLEQLVRRAVLVVTDYRPTVEWEERIATLADGAECRVATVDSLGVVPVAALPREEYAARTIRPKLARLLDLALEPVEDEAPRRAVPDAVQRSLTIECVDPASLDARRIAEIVARCRIDHAVGAVETIGGTAAARRRLDAFCADGLPHYSERRRHPSDTEGTSQLSPYLRHGMISAGEIARTVRRSGPPSEVDAFLDQLITWRELSINFCARNPSYATLAALPDWVHRSMERHAGDEREWIYDLSALERAATHSPLWNAAQRELVVSGRMHNVARMLWGKSVVTWTGQYEDALAWLLHLNDRYALDGCDPDGYAGIQWCFGKFDRPFAERPVWGTIRPMSLERARTKYDVAAYLARWSGASTDVARTGR